MPIASHFYLDGEAAFMDGAPSIKTLTWRTMKPPRNGVQAGSLPVIPS
jgi:hypothetical protein